MDQAAAEVVLRAALLKELVDHKGAEVLLVEVALRPVVAGVATGDGAWRRVKIAAKRGSTTPLRRIVHSATSTAA